MKESGPHREPENAEKHSLCSKPVSFLHSLGANGDSPRRAFTLLEVIISIALTSTLMVLVWSLFSTYTKLEERSRQSATEIQLVRSLSRQLRSDLDHFAALAIPPNIVPEPQVKTQSDEDSFLGGPDNAIETGSLEDQNSQSTQLSMLSDQAAVFDSPNLFNARLPEQTFLRGSATRLEIVTRLPSTIDVPNGQQRLGAETRYGTFQFVVYEFSDARDLKSLLNSDPVLNPSLLHPSPTQTPAGPNQPPPVARPLNPNDSVGLYREAKSWLQFTRDRRRESMFKRAEAAGLLVDGQLPPAEQPRDLLTELQEKTNGMRPSLDPIDGISPATWTPPPEFKAKRDDLPEVTRLQFRYFDGSSWQLEWSDEKNLPYAIEVAFDLDPDAPAVRAKEFAEAHELVLNGATIDDVLPPDDMEVSDFEDEQDPLTALNLADPTAIVTEYRFVLSLPHGGGDTTESTEPSNTDGLGAEE